MNDLDILAEFRVDVPPAEPTALRAARDRLLSTPAPTSSSMKSRRSRRIGLRWRLAIGGAVAVAAAAALAVPGLVGVKVPTSTPDTEAAHILQHAALVAQELPMADPDPNQLVFIESVTDYANANVNSQGVTTWTNEPPKLRQIWLSVDGRSNGLLRERPLAGPGAWTFTYQLAGCRNGHANPVPRQVSDDSCDTRPAYRGDLPTTADAMLKYLYRHSDGGNPRDQQAFVTVGDTIRESYLPPAALSAMFAAAARIPGVTVDHDAVDASGRHGIAVARTFNGIAAELIFDPDTYRYLGDREVATQNGDGLTTGQVIGSSAVQRVAIVDQVAQLP
jgi:hypothetical protein